MKYFTPELYIQYNSPDDREADRADEAWETAIQAYQAHVDSFRASMSPRILDLAEGPTLHDAELIALRADLPEAGQEASPVPMAATISLKQEEQIIHLDYLLWGLVVQLPPPHAWPYSSSRVHWLYDEVDFEGDGPEPRSSSRGRFWHRILLSDGRSVAIPFVDVIISQFSPEHPEPDLVTRAGR